MKQAAYIHWNPWLLLVIVSAISLAACQTTPPRFSCSVPSGFGVSAAFAHAQSDLSHEECQFQFDSYVNTLLDISASSPKSENKKQFSELFIWARDHGILGQTQAENYYRRYFTPMFVSLDKDYNNCSTTCRDKQKLVKRMKDELRDKDRGLLKAGGDRQGYNQADREYNQLLTLIDATCLACEKSR